MTATRRGTTAPRTLAAVVLGVLLSIPLALTFGILSATTAEATTYRYWTYWWGSGTGKAATGWTFASQGPASHAVGDTWVLGWRFATSSATSSTPPRQSPDFAALCPTLASPVAGAVRVALVIDYGTTADAPPGQRPPLTTSVRVECLTLPLTPAPRGSTALNSATPAVVVRQDTNGLICALDGYPVGECAPVIADPTPVDPAPIDTAPIDTAPIDTAPVDIAPTTTGPTVINPTVTTRPDTKSTLSASPAIDAPAIDAPALEATGTTPAGVGQPDANGAANTSAVTVEPTLPAVTGAPIASAADPSSGPNALVSLVGVLIVGLLVASAWWTTRRGGGSP